MEPSEYARIAEVEEAHFWYRGLRAAVLGALARRLPPPPAGGRRLLDAGCGPGGLARRLARFGRVVGVDLSEQALALCGRPEALPPPARVRAGVQALPFPDRSFDAAVSTDVLYHRAVADDGAALAEIARVCRPGALVVLNLPAHEALRGAHDVVVHTARRYARADVERLARRAGLSVESLVGFNAALLPVAWVARRLQARASAPPRSDLALPPAPLNAALSAWMAVEAGATARGWTPFGLSLFAVLRRP